MFKFRYFPPSIQMLHTVKLLTPQKEKNSLQSQKYYFYTNYLSFAKNCSMDKTVNWHREKSVQIRSYFWSTFSCFRTEYRKIRTRNNSVFGYFSRNVGKIIYRGNAIKFEKEKSLLFQCSPKRYYYRTDFFNKSFIWSHLLKKSLLKNFIFCAVRALVFNPIEDGLFGSTHIWNRSLSALYPIPKIFYVYLKIMKLGKVIRSLEKLKNIRKSRDLPPLYKWIYFNEDFIVINVL